MIETSDTYKRLWAAGARTEVALAIGRGPELIDENGNVLLFGDTAICAGLSPDHGLREDDLASVTITQRAMDSSGPSVGGAYSGEIDATLYATDVDIPKRAMMRPYVRLTDEAETSEWVPQGVFFVDTRQLDSPDGVPKRTLHGYDAMLLAERDYPESALQWPATDINVVEEITKTIGITLYDNTRQTISRGYLIQYPEGYSCREVLGEIAGMYGGNFAVAIDGTLRLVPLWGGTDLHNAEDDVLGDYSTDEPMTWDSVELDLDDVVYITAGAGDSVLRLDCVNGTKRIAADLLSAMDGVVYQPFAAQKTILDPAVDLGDLIRLPTVTGALFGVTRYLGAMYTADLEAPGSEELDHEFPYSPGEDRKQLRRYKKLRSDVDILMGKMQQIELLTQEG